VEIDTDGIYFASSGGRENGKAGENWWDRLNESLAGRN